MAEKAMKAKYNGQCTSCNKRISVGQDILWEQGTKKARHANCENNLADTTAWRAPLGFQEPTKEEAPVRIVERRGWSKPERDDRVGDMLRTSKNRKADDYPDTVVVVTAQKRNFLSREDAEDIAGPDDAGWSVTLYCRLATAEETASFEQKEADKANAKRLEAEAKQRALEAKKAAEEAEKAKAAEATQGLVYAGECSDCPNDSVSHERIAEIVSSLVTQRWTYRTLTDGSRIVLSETSFSDDHRFSWYGTRAQVEAGWRSYAATYQITPEKATAWLAKYKGCSGTELYEFIANSANTTSPAQPAA